MYKMFLSHSLSEMKPEDDRFLPRLSLILVLALGPMWCVAQTIPGATVIKGEEFHLYEVMVPMRDSTRLQTVIMVPKDQNKPLPFLLSRSPYGVPDSDKRIVESQAYDELMADGYIFVFQNVRGRFRSEGQFVMNQPPRRGKDSKTSDDSTDAYDTIDWLLKNVPDNNGRVGIFGASYAGWTAVMALRDPHPALKAVSEEATSADMFLGDDFHHNGAFRLSYGFEYASLVEASKEQNTHFQFDKYDTYEWYLSLGPLSHANTRYLHGSVQLWNDFVAHPNYDDFWRRQAFATFLRPTIVPVLNVAGWWDQEDFYGPMKVYELLNRDESNGQNYVVAGPWNHGGWTRGTGRSLGVLGFGSDTAKYFRAQVQAPWFAYWLHGKGKLPQSKALMFETGTNEWKPYNTWPPTLGVEPRKLYFRAGHKLSFEHPNNSDGQFDIYLSDPDNPVPYRPRPITPTYPHPDWKTWLVRDQRFADHRPDVLSWQTEPLTKDLVITGDITADLFASTSGTDSDWVVKLIDVFPDNNSGNEDTETRELGGYQLMIAAEVFRGRFHDSFDRPMALPPNHPLEYKIDLHTNDHAFLKGHRIMVQVQSTWFPLIDRNPQTFVANIFWAKERDYVGAKQTIYRVPGKASCIVLPVATQ
jgi:hypothetical protein